MPNLLENTREDFARALRARIKRLDNTTEKGNRTGTLAELEGAEKDVARATDRLSRARVAHALATREVAEYADALRGVGGEPELPEGFQVYVNPERVAPVYVNTDTGEELDSTGSPVDPEREPEPNNDDEDDQEAPVTELGRLAAESDSQPRQGGRLARRGTQVG